MDARTVIFQAMADFKQARDQAKGLADDIKKVTKAQDEQNASNIAAAKSGKDLSNAQAGQTAELKKGTEASKSNVAEVQKSILSNKQLLATLKDVAESRKKGTLEAKAATATVRSLTAAERAYDRAVARVSSTERAATSAKIAMHKAQQDALSGAANSTAKLAQATEHWASKSNAAKQAAEDMVSVTKKLHQEQTAATQALQRAAGVGGGNGGMDKFLSGAENAADGVARFAGHIGDALPMMAVFLPMIVQMGVGLFALTAALTPALSGLAALPGAFMLAAQAGASLMAAFNGVKAALGAGFAAFRADGSLNQTPQEAAQRNLQMIQGQHAIAEAEHGIQEAQYNATQAQKALTQARLEATRQIRDLRNAVIDAELAERGASLSLEEAKRNLAIALATPGKTALEIQQAQLTVDEANQKLVESHQKVGDAVTDSNKASALGVEGSNSVIEANHAVQESLRGITEAQYNLVQAQRQLAIQQMQITAQLTAFQEAMKQLPKSAQDLVWKLLDLRKAWNDVSNAVADATLPGVTSFFQNIIDILPKVQNQLVATGAIFGKAFSDAGKTIASDEWQKSFQNIGNAMQRSISNLLDGFGKLFDLFRRISDVMSEQGGLFDFLSKSVDNFFTGLDNKAKNNAEGMQNYFGPNGTVIKALKDVGHFFGDWFKIVGNLLGAARQPGQAWANDILDTLDRWVKWTGDPKNQSKIQDFFTKGKDAAEHIANAIITIGSVVAQISLDLAPITSFLADMSKVLLAPGIKQILELLLEVMLAAKLVKIGASLFEPVIAGGRKVNNARKSLATSSEDFNAGLAGETQKYGLVGEYAQGGGFFNRRARKYAAKDNALERLAQQAEEQGDTAAAAKYRAKLAKGPGLIRRGVTAFATGHRGNEGGFIDLGGGVPAEEAAAAESAGPGLLSRVGGRAGGVLGKAGGLLGKFGRVAGPLAIIGGLLADPISNLIGGGQDPKKSVRGAAGAITGGALQGAALGAILGPEGALAGALIGGLWAAFTKTKLGKIIEDWWKKDAWPFLKKIPDFFGDILRPVGHVIGKIFDGIGLLFKGLWKFVETWFKTEWWLVEHLFLKPIQAVWDWLGNTAWPGIQHVFSGMWNWVSGTFKTLWDGFEDIFLKPVKGIVDALPGIWNKIQDIFMYPVKLVFGKVIVPLAHGAGDILKALGDPLGVGTFLSGWKAPEGFAKGNWVPGEGDKDTIPAMLTPGEFVIRKAAAARLNREHPGALEQLNQYDKRPKYGIGGVVGDFWNAVKATAGAVGTVDSDILGLAKQGLDQGLGLTDAVLEKIGAKKAGKWLLGKGWGALSGLLKTILDSFLDPNSKAVPILAARQAALAPMKAVGDFIAGAQHPQSSGNGAGGVGHLLGLFGAVGGGAAQWRPLVIKALQELGQDASDAVVNAVLSIIQHESGGNPQAINLTDSNAKAGHPSQGLMQTIPSTFAAYAGPYISAGITDPYANIYAGINYAISRYGSIANVPGIRSLASGGGYKGYAGGGLVGLNFLKPGLAYNMGGFAGSSLGGLTNDFSRKYGGTTIEQLHINNPRPEAASDSLPRALRKATKVGVFQ